MESLAETQLPRRYHDMGVFVRKEVMMPERRSGYSIEEVRTSDTGRVLDFLRRFFFRDEPLNLCIGLLDEQPNCSELEAFCTQSIPEGLSFMAVSPTNEILGVCLNGVLSGHEEEEVECSHPKFQKILDLLGRVSREADVLGRYRGIGKALDIKVASVHEQHRGKGIIKALILATREMAKERGFQMVKVDCSSHFSALAVSRLGFSCVYSLEYKDHLGPDGMPVFVPEPPHSTVKTYVAILQ